MASPQKKLYTIRDIYALPDGKRAELIDGQIFMMTPPSARHQDIVFAISRRIADYIDAQKGDCKIYLAPYAVFLNADDRNYVEPDISVICDRSKLDDRGCIGAPDWVIEVASPSTERMDYGIKLFRYRSAGVREYWIVNPMKRAVNVFDLAYGDASALYGLDDDIPVCIYEDLTINIQELL